MVGLLQGISRARAEKGRVIFLSSDLGETLPWSEFFAEAERVAAWLQSAKNAGPGSRIVVLGLPSREVVTAIVAAWMAGAAVTCAPTPARTMDLAGYVAQTRSRLAALGNPLVLLGAPFEELSDGLSEGGAKVELLADVLAGQPLEDWKDPALVDDHPAIFQFTSGTTSMPKIVKISHGNLAANILAIRERIRHEDVHGRLLSWLPLSHDMGLIGALAVQLTCGQCDVIFGSPADYQASPASWMRNAAQYRATVLLAPAAAYAMAGRLLTAGPALDLTSVKVALSGGEPIDPDLIERFLDAGARHGLRREVFLPAYGLAEATLAVTMPSPYRGLCVDEIDADLLAERQLAVPPRNGCRARRLTRLGPPVPGAAVRIVDPSTGTEQPERRIGEIHVSGPSVAEYLTAGAAAEDEGTPLMHGGWLATGDLGYLTDGELVVCGRIKDLIIVGGRNIHPEEIEQAAAQVRGVRPGNVVAFAVRHGRAGTDSVAVAFELRPGHEAVAVREAVSAAVLAAVGVRPVAVHALPPGSIPKTPSGKLQRAEAGRMWAGEL